jgi:hypothetical protein
MKDSSVGVERDRLAPQVRLIDGIADKVESGLLEPISTKTSIVPCPFGDALGALLVPTSL